METVYDLLADLPATATLDGGSASLSARELRATAYRVSNYLRSRGVHESSRVGISADGGPKPLLGLLGSALLAAPVVFDPPSEFDGRAVLAPASEVARYELGPGGQLVAYGARPDDPAVGYFEGDVWSENPSFPPVTFGGDALALDGDEPVTQRALLADAAAFAESLDADDAVALRAPLARSGTVVAALAGFRTGASVLIPADGETGTVAVAETEAPESRTVAPADLR